MNELYAAWAKANAAISNPNKDGKGNYGAYLTLDQLLDHTRKTYAEHGLVWYQQALTDDGEIRVTTFLAHESGDVLDFGTLTAPMGATIQQMGSARTYLSRYAYLTAMGIAGGEDDDGQTHTDTVAMPARDGGGRVNMRKAGPATDKQIAMIVRLMREQHITEVTLNEFTFETLGFEVPRDGLDKLDKAQASAIIDALTKTPITRTKVTRPDPDDPWATAPLVDPTTGEVAS